MNVHRAELKVWRTEAEKGLESWRRKGTLKEKEK